MLFLIIPLVEMLTSGSIINSSLLILFILCWLSGKEKHDIFNPYYLLAFTPLSVLIYDTSFNSYFLIEIDAFTYFVIFLGILSFFLGLKFSERIKIKDYSKQNYRITKKLFWFILILGTLPHFLGLYRVGIPILNIANLEQMRMEYLPGGISYFIFFLPLTILIAFYLQKRNLIIISLLFNLFFSIVRVAKFDFLIFLIFFLYAYFKYGNISKQGFKKKIVLILSFLLIPIVFAIAYFLRSGIVMNENEFYSLNMPNTFSGYVALPYFYITTPWSNFAFNFNHVTEFNWGLYTLRPFLSAAQILDYFHFNSPKTIFQHPFNTYAFLTDYFMDFGVLGIIVLPFLTAAIVYHAYKKSKVSNNPLVAGQYIILGIPTLFLFFSNHFTSVGYPFIVYIAYGFINMSLKKSKT